MKKFFCLFLLSLLFNLQLSCFAEFAKDKVDVQLTQIPLSSKLKKDYNGYRYTVTNNSGENVNIVNAQVTNAVNGSIAYNAVNDGHPIGTTWAICGPLGLITLGVAWIGGIIATPIVWVVSEGNNKKAQKESISYPNIINIGTVANGDVLTTEFLVPIGTKPQLKMTVQPEKTKELVNINL